MRCERYSGERGRCERGRVQGKRCCRGWDVLAALRADGEIGYRVAASAADTEWASAGLLGGRVR